MGSKNGQQSAKLKGNMSTVNTQNLQQCLDDHRATEILINTTRRGYIDIKEHRELLDIFKKAGVCNDMTLFDDVQDNPVIAAGIVLKLAAGLPETIEDSIYGKPYLSDFDFKNRCLTQELTERYFLEKGIDIPKPVFIDLWTKKKKNLNAWLIRKKNTVIYNFGLEGTYDVNILKKTPTKKAVVLKKSPEDIKSDLNAKANKLFTDSVDIPEAVIFCKLTYICVILMFLYLNTESC